MRRKLIPRFVQRRVRNSLTYILVLAIFLVFIMGLYRGGVHLAHLKAEEITIRDLPSALLLSMIRMTASYLASLVFAFFLGLLAARTKLGERLIIPLLDILQSVPVVAFFPVAISVFIRLTGGHRVGIEMAASFLIFTSQAWNMAFAVYEATKTIPHESIDAVNSLGVNGSQKFWKLYAPAAVPRLVYNSILSWSNGWFFLVACEIIAVGQIQYHLPGIGSFLARAAEQDHIHLVFWGLLALTSLILTLDFLIWRPASVWAERFRQESVQAGVAEKRITRPQMVFRRTVAKSFLTISEATGSLLKTFFFPLSWSLKQIVMPLVWDLPAAIVRYVWAKIYLSITLPAGKQWNDFLRRARWVQRVTFTVLGIGLGLWAGRALYHLLEPPWPSLARDIPVAILASTGRLIVSLVLSLLWILPVVLWSWNKPRVRQALNTVAQIGASLPATALFPLIIILAVKKFGGGMEIAVIALLMSGMQWYILFNGLGGTMIIPNDLAEVTATLGLSRVQAWKRLVLPAIRPALITGMITSWGGGWNALVVSEYLNYKGKTLTVNGLGALLSHAVYDLGDTRAIAICIAAMISWIILINVVVWRPLYLHAAERYKMDS